jgi:uncharacterized radical SAM superfamily Fe-S cluster-containing enzyme
LTKPIKHVEKAVAVAANAAWFVFDKLNSINPNPGFVPKWSDKPLLKSWEKQKAEARLAARDGFAVPQVRPRDPQQDSGRQTAGRDPRNEKGRRDQGRDHRARRQDPDGEGLPHPRPFRRRDVDRSGFLKHLEDVFPGRDIRAHNDEKLHDHGTSTITHGRGSVLTVDLTNRCNMMCDPCFMDANQVGFVHELSWEEIKTLLDNAMTIKPRRQLSVQFSGGEPTLSPHFLDAVRYCRKLGYQSVQAATNGIEFAKRPEFAKEAAEAGLRYAYLQFDGIGNAANSHRAVGNLFDVKLRAIENLYSAGVDIVPVITLINGVNNEQVGAVVRFALANPKKIPFLSFQPVSFTGRDEAITDERRQAQRYTLANLAHDVKNQTGLGEPTRDWFPISFMSTFSDFADLVHGPNADWGQLSCGCHPNCGVGMAVMCDKETKEYAPVTAFLNADRLARDVARINDAARSKRLSVIGVSLALLRNYNPYKAPTHFRLSDLVAKFDKCFGMSKKSQTGAYGKVTGDRTIADIEKRRADRWNFLFIAGMWFQDLFNYDFRRTEQCIIPYATQEGEISFCAYNTGVGWRNIVEKMHMTATLTKWYEEHGRHEIIAGGKQVALPSAEHSLVLNQDDVNHGIQHDLDNLGIAKTAREEKKRARDAKLKEQQEQEQMMKLYREHVLGEKPQADVVPLTSILPAPAANGKSPNGKPSAEKVEAVGSFGD